MSTPDGDNIGNPTQHLQLQQSCAKYNEPLTRKRSFDINDTDNLFQRTEQSVERVKRHRSKKTTLENVVVDGGGASPVRHCDMDADVNATAVKPFLIRHTLEKASSEPSLHDIPCSSSSSFRTPLRAQSSIRGEAKKVRFKNVDLFLFPRSQGFGTVPTKGGTALGMGEKHHDVKKLSVAEHEVLMMYGDRNLQCDTESNRMGVFSQRTGRAGEVRRGSVSYEEEGEMGNERGDATIDESFMERESEEVINGTNFLLNPSTFFKSPLDERTRRRILRAAGIQVDKSDRENCNLIRSSREICGCSCTGGRCSPSSCECIREEICCQNERPAFPCTCSAETCKNPNGFVEFNVDRVQSHKNSVFIRQRHFTDSFGTASPSHTYFEDSRIRSTYLPLTPTVNKKRDHECPVPVDSETRITNRSRFCTIGFLGREESNDLATVFKCQMEKDPEDGTSISERCESGESEDLISKKNAVKFKKSEEILTEERSDGKSCCERCGLDSFSYRCNLSGGIDDSFLREDDNDNYCRFVGANEEVRSS